MKQTDESIATRTELSEAPASSATDRVPEVVVLNIVRDLGGHIYQIAVSLTEELEELKPPPATSQMDVDPTSRPRIPTLVQLAHNRDLTGLTFLFQLCLCSQVARITSSWGHYQELTKHKSIYRHLLSLGDHRGASNLSETEVVDPQSPHPTTARFRVVGGVVSEHP